MRHQNRVALIPVVIGLLVGLLAPQRGSALPSPIVVPDQHFTVDAAGNISPQEATLHSGQTAVWTFETASPANALVRQSWASSNYVAAPYDPSYANELMTPLPKGMSGMFVISENQGGLVEQTTPCVGRSQQRATRSIDGTLWYLCTSDPSPTAPNYQRTMDATWAWGGSRTFRIPCSTARAARGQKTRPAMTSSARGASAQAVQTGG